MTSYPKEFKLQMAALLGKESNDFFRSLEMLCPVSIRLNPKKAPLDISGNEPILWANNGYYLNERPVFTLDPLLHAGAYYVQEASSMFLEQALINLPEINDNLKVLDLCAAPGGKTTHLASLISPDSLLISNEVISSRAKILTENVIKWGYDNVVVSNNDPRKFANLKGFFDIILIDAPCSGEGLFRRDKNAINEWSENAVAHCASRQKRIIGDIWEALKPGGVLIYSTCTYNQHENEETLQWVRDNYHSECISVSLPQHWNITETATNEIKGYHFYPHKTKGEGFFMGIMRKSPEDGKKEEVWSPNKRSGIQPKLNKAIQGSLSNWLNQSERYDLLQHHEVITAIPKTHFENIQLLKNNLNVVHHGIPLASVKKNDLVPQHALALSLELRKEAFPLLELCLEDALTYLRKGNIVCNDLVKGWAIVTYKGLPLGFVKNIGNRINNYYPKEWRIRM